MVPGELSLSISLYRKEMMTIGLSHHHQHQHHLVCFHSLHRNPHPFFYSTIPRSKPLSFHYYPSPLPSIPKSSSPKNPSPTTPVETSPQQSKSPNSIDPDPDPDSHSDSSFFNSLSITAIALRKRLKFDELGWDILSIALPAALALAADPITSLFDIAFVGHLGSVELAAVGVSVSVFNLVSKLFNVPLLNITTSFVAEEQASLAKRDDNFLQNYQGDRQNKKLLPSVSTSLALAAAIGVAEALALSVGSSFLMNIMGISVDSPIRIPAEQFLTLRALGAGNLLNAILDPILILIFGLGISGAAIATVISEYLIAFVLLWKLNDNVLLISPNIYGQKIAQYLKSGGLLIARTLAVLLMMTLATSMAAREGPIPMAGHQICLQIWLALSLLNDALALAGQALLASGYSQVASDLMTILLYWIHQFGLASGISLALILFLGFGALSSLFTNDKEVLEIARSGTLFVAASQPINALAFVLDGLYYGVSDFGFAAYSMVLIGVISSVFLLVAAPVFGLAGVWAGLFLFMSLRVVAGIWRLGTRSGPWELVWSAKVDQESD
ncbi:hypothetical protein LguiA_016438 [Lonicera macranthoides]